MMSSNVEALFERGDLGLGAEHAERPRIEPHRHSRDLVGHSSLDEKGGRSRPFRTLEVDPHTPSNNALVM